MAITRAPTNYFIIAQKYNTVIMNNIISFIDIKIKSLIRVGFHETSGAKQAGITKFQGNVHLKVGAGVLVQLDKSNIKGVVSEKIAYC